MGDPFPRVGRNGKLKSWSEVEDPTSLSRQGSTIHIEGRAKLLLSREVRWTPHPARGSAGVSPSR